MYKKLLLAIVAGALIWSGVNPNDRLTWAMEIAPVVIALPIILAAWRRFPLTNLLYGLLAFHAIVLIVGGKYTYAEMPLFNLLRDSLHLARNHYDRLGHLVQGFVPALLIRELLLRTTPLKAGKWLFVIVVFFTLGISASYELFEWQAALILGSNADAFLAVQGDPWDTQNDMAWAGIGAILSQLFLSRVHDRELRDQRNQKNRLERLKPSFSEIN